MMDWIVVFIYEMIGTMILVGAISFFSAVPGGAFAVPFALFISIQIGGGITGGHFNPAVTMAVLVGRSRWSDLLNVVLYYWCA